MMKFLLVVMKFLVIASILFSIVSADPVTPGPWNRTWFEDWTLPLQTNWLVDFGTSYPGGSPQWGTGEVETYTNEPSNLHMIEGPALAITPQLGSDGTWTSGRIESLQDFICEQTAKLYIEAVIQIGDAPESQSQGIWPAFWALGRDFRGNYQNWPKVTEWDIFENLNGLPAMYTTIHCGTNPGGPCNEATGISSNTPFTKGVWHTVGFEVDTSMSGDGKSGTWLDETLNWYLDGVLVFSVNGARVNDLQAWTQLAAAPHFLILNVAVGGSFPNAVAGVTTPNPATIGGPTVGMSVLSVSVWKTAPDS